MKTAAEVRKEEIIQRFEVIEKKMELVKSIREAQSQYKSFEELFAVYKTVGYTNIQDVHAITQAIELNILNTNSFTVEELKNIFESLKSNKETTNKNEKVENKMDFIKCNEKELNALEMVVKAIETFENVHDSESDVKHDLEVTNDHDLHGLSYDIKNNEIFENWLKFKNGETKVTAYDAANYTGAQIIEILHNNYDKIFGYYEEKGEKIFFVSETKENWNDETEQDEIYFLVEETPVSLSECMRINI